MKSAGVTSGTVGIGNRFAAARTSCLGGMSFPFTSAAQDRIGSGWRFLAASSMTELVRAARRRRPARRRRGGVVAAYLAERAESRKLSTVQASAAAIAAAARAAGRADPTKTPLVADTLRGIARQHAATAAAAPRQAAALDYATALDLMRAAARPQRRGRGRETPSAAAGRGRRDAAIVALAFCAGLRRSEIASLVWGDITPTARAGQLRVRVRASKTNASGRREDLRLLAGPFARAVDRLRTAEEPAAAERVVPLGPHQVNRRVKVLAAALGIEGVSSHSGRRGLASELIRRGASTTAVQTAGGWQSAAMVARYASAVDVEDGAVARLFGGGG